MFRFFQFLWLIFSISYLIPIIHAQSTNATCLPSYNWLNNSKNQNPCLVSAYVRAACTPGTASFIPALHGPNMTYVGPLEDKASTCTCSSVTYSLISACAFCQGGQVPRWSEWTRNCPRNLVYNGEYLHTIPPGTIVPGWAYTPVSNRTDRWDVTNALSIVTNNPSNTSTTSASTSTSGKLFNTIPDPISSSPTSSFSASTTVPTLANSSPISSPSSTFSPPSAIPSVPSQNDNQRSNKHRAFVGIIVGSVLGGLIVIGLLAFAAYYTYRRHHYRPRRSNIQPVLSPTPTGPMTSTLDESFVLSSYSPATASSYKPNSPLVMVYNPEDPSTYPDPTYQPISYRNPSPLVISSHQNANYKVW